MAWKDVLERYANGLCLEEALPGAAADALEEGYDSPTLRMLAASKWDDGERIAGLLNRALMELGMRMPTDEEAAMAWARRIAGHVVAGELSPYEGARQIWWKVCQRYPRATQKLLPFVGYASEYEDDPSHREENSRAMLEEFRRLVGGGNEPPLSP